MSRELTLEEKATNDSTWKHIFQVARFLLLMIEELHQRILLHDQTKLVPPEVEAFTKYTPMLKGLTYGSKEYRECLRQMAPAIKHHYAHHRHHPEHFEKGIEGMHLIDLVEMMCDWKAATLRHGDGGFEHSLEINCKRFGIEPQLAAILLNTIEFIESLED